ncbi:hypothetical protein [Salsipaludibacter albus]|nr:hypothetical protein [Salsipaludibacter albus]
MSSRSRKFAVYMFVSSFTLLTILLGQRYFVQGVASSGVKG